MSGAGNLFVMIDGRDLPQGPDLSEVARYACAPDSPTGGADGLIVIDGSERATFDMRYWNRDGSTGMMCGNGARCAVRLAANLGFVKDTEQIDFDNAGRAYRAVLEDNRVVVRFADDALVQLNRPVAVEGGEYTVHFVELGSPHFVLFSDELDKGTIDELDVERWGRALRQSPEAGPEGLNVNFVAVQDESTIRLRTYERGVEEETGACGTGAIASGIVAHLVRGTAHPMVVLPSSGSPLTVDFAIADHSNLSAIRVSGLSLSGNAEIIDEGRLDLPASVGT
jgi:diaminopimelate epimerase